MRLREFDPSDARMREESGVDNRELLFLWTLVFMIEEVSSVGGWGTISVLPTLSMDDGHLPFVIVLTTFPIS